MTDSDRRTEERAADLLPEERRAGSSDAEEQAEAILADSDERTNHSRDRGAAVEHRDADGTDREG